MTSSTVPAATSSSASRNIWAGSDSDFVPSPEVAVASDTAVVRPVKRRKVAAKGKVAKVKAVKPPLDGNLRSVLPPPPASPVSDLGVPLSLTHSRKVGTTDSVWDLIHVLDKPYRKRNPWKPST
ncbi:hypothetical protein DVH05_009560 [Phytophthora capsici]|nr:hypothetical protein DVH05_009560 [Phytophthora capsici]